jgi:peptide/nickel transport system substrate-binding protein
MSSTRSVFRRWIGLVLAVAVIASACGDDGDDDAEPAAGDTNAPTTVAETPVAGGTITMSVFSEASGLDPITISGAGVTGGAEMVAIYDSVMRYNPETGEYEPRTAESLTPNSDFSVWTLKLKPGIKFSDGTDYDAEAVRYSIERHKSPANRTPSAGAVQNVKEATVVDTLTLRITLTGPWPGFPAVLASSPGYVPSPTAVKACGATPPRECPFNLSPVGAGPFVIDSFKPKEAITMTRNPNFYGGPVYLDGLKFVFIPGGAAAGLEALKAGGVQVAYLREPEPIDAAKEEEYPGYSNLQQNGANMLMNIGVTVQCAGGEPAAICAGKPDGPQVTDNPTKSLKVRQAIAAAIDTEVINERAYGGTGFPGTEFVQESFRYYSGVEGPEYDPERARQLVQEAKQEGWDGRVRYFSSNVPSTVNRALAVKTMLEAVGITVELDSTKSTTDHVAQITVARDYDLTIWGSPQLEDSDLSWVVLDQALRSDSPANRVGYKSADMDRALLELKVASTDDAKKAAYSKISELLARDLPWLTEGAVEEYIAWQPEVQGIYANLATTVYFDKAWIKN